MSAATLDQIIGRLRRPYTPAAVRWKIQTNPKDQNGKAMVVGFIDSRLVAERLNEVVGGDWSDSYGPLNGTNVVCALTVLGATREDVGWTRDVSTDMGVKTVYSDAFKRAAVKFGVGAFLYAMPSRWVPAANLNARGDKWYLTRETEQVLARGYGQWLGSPDTVKRFGEPIDHGDQEPAA